MRWAGRLLVVLVLAGGVVALVRLRQDDPAPTGDPPPASPVAKAEQPPAAKPPEAAKPVAPAVPPPAASVAPPTPIAAPSAVFPPPATVGMLVPVPPLMNLEPAHKPALPTIPTAPATLVPTGATVPMMPPVELPTPPNAVRPMAVPYALPDAPGLPDVPPPAELTPKPTVAVPPLPVAKFKPLSAAPAGAGVVYLNQARVAVEYEVTKKGPSGLGTVELWVKDANGWSKAATAKAGGPVEADLPADGAYGTKVVPVSGQGLRGPEPAKDAEPDLWVVRDTTPPVVTFKVTPAPWREGDPPVRPFIVELTATDANLSCETLVVEWGEGDKPPATPLFTGKDLGKEKIETKLGVFVPHKPAPEKGEKPASGLGVVLDWKPALGVPARVSFRVLVKDKAGNVGSALHPNLGTDLTAPAAKVTGVRGLPGR